MTNCSADNQCFPVKATGTGFTSNVTALDSTRFVLLIWELKKGLILPGLLTSTSAVNTSGLIVNLPLFCGKMAYLRSVTV